MSRTSNGRSKASSSGSLSLSRDIRGHDTRTYISLFSGAGIGCHGLDMAGFSCVATVESIPRRLEIQRHNNKCLRPSGYICGDITLPGIWGKIEDEVACWGLESPGALDAVIATPPCQGMSVCNHKKGDEQPRNSLVTKAIEAVARFRPKFFVFENTALFLKKPCTLEDGREMLIGDAITEKLGEMYNILPQKLNLKNHGCPSSRTRSLVIGTDKSLWFSPLGIVPDWESEVTLREVIGDLPPLPKMGQIAKGDLYHSAKPYAQHMRAWISSLREGEGAFDQPDPAKRPHRFVKGRRVENKNANGDKYRRQRWDAVAPCVHTRNDILSSQNTVHPSDDRVFSIREVMRMMSVPEGFKWAEKKDSELSSLPKDEQRRFLSANEINIRQCLGEAAPPEVLRRIAKKARTCLATPDMANTRNRKDGVLAAMSAGMAKTLIGLKNEGYAMEALLSEIEMANERRNEHAAYYTPPAVAFKLLQLMPDLRPKKKIRILEPSAGIGRLLHFLPSLLAGYDEVVIDAMDIDERALGLARALMGKMPMPGHVKVNYIHGDFLGHGFDKGQYDLIVGNPPFGKIATAEARRQAGLVDSSGSKNIFGHFLDKSLKLARHVVLIAPKGFLCAPDFAKLRSSINAAHTLRAICDFGEKGFKGVRIETMAMAIATNRKQRDGDLIDVESMPLNLRDRKPPSSVFGDGLPYWLIYRNEQFDQMLDKLEPNIFKVFRDRQISKKHFCSRGIPLIKSANIDARKVFPTKPSIFVRDASNFAACRFMNREDVLLAPNLSYDMRACRMPTDSIADGSVAVLYPRNGNCRLDDDDVRFFASDEFRSYYRIARNHGTRSLNIDADSVFFFGKRRAHAG